MIFIKSFFKYYIKALSTSNNTHYKKKKKKPDATLSTKDNLCFIHGIKSY